MITRFHIENFKSLADFDLMPDNLALPAFSCLVGLNGSGKSTVIQALDFAANVALGKPDDWLRQRGWHARELPSHTWDRPKQLVKIAVEATHLLGRVTSWTATLNLQRMRCTEEAVHVNGVKQLEFSGNELKVSAGPDLGNLHRYQGMWPEYKGSVLSAFVWPIMYNEISLIRDMLLRLGSSELLSPQAMRRRGRTAHDIGAGGENLSAYLGTFHEAKLWTINRDMHSFYPQFKELTVKSLKSGLRQLEFEESFGCGSSTDANHINDGMLRVLAIIAQAHTDHSFLLFDEIENGINPALVPKLMEYLVNLTRDGRKQVMVTTHSPVILNYLDDEVAKEGVILLYKKQDGKTRSIRYFDIPENARKLKSLGPGEVFVDTDLTELVESLPGEPEPLESDPPKAAPARRK